MRARLRHPALAAGIAASALLGAAGCAGPLTPPAVTPITVRLADIQSGTVHVSLHQVVRIESGGTDRRYSASIADERVVSVVQHRDEAGGGFDPELVPLRVGATQVALISSVPGETVVGFKVVVTPYP
jgi:hypothetical protein